MNTLKDIIIHWMIDEGFAPKFSSNPAWTYKDLNNNDDSWWLLVADVGVKAYFYANKTSVMFKPSCSGEEIIINATDPDFFKKLKRLVIAHGK